jgi:Bacterial transcriptional regulator
VLVLTERTDHLESLRLTLEERVKQLFVLHGRLARKARTAQLAALNALADAAPRVVLASGRLVGEGFDHPALARSRGGQRLCDSREEWRDNVGGVAAPVFDALTAPAAALAISGELKRLGVKRTKESSPAVQHAALKISRTMGYGR